VVPTIENKYLRGHNTNININLQHDNAPAHFTKEHLALIAMNNEQVGWLLSLKEQPPNLPDTNTLDFGFFVAIQSIQWGMTPAFNIESLVANIEAIFVGYDPHMLDRVWISHKACQNEVIAFIGGNHNKQLHLGKHNLVNNFGVLPPLIQVSDKAEVGWKE
jgi:hypothetical protein